MKATNGTLILAIVLALTCSASAQQKRPLNVEDIFQPYTLNGETLSLDGEMLAYVSTVDNAKLPITNNNPSKPRPRMQSTVWIATVSNGALRQVTTTAADGWIFRQLIWSPDGQRLLIISERLGEYGLWLWEKPGNRLRQIVARRLRAPSGLNSNLLPVWISNHQVLYALIPEEGNWGLDRDPNDPEALSLTEETANRSWQRTREGREASRSVIESGASAGDEERPKGSLEIADVLTGKKTTLVTENATGFAVSPDRRQVAAVVRIGTGTTPPESQKPFRADPLRQGLIVKSLVSEAVWRSRRTDGDVVDRIFPRWSSDSRFVVFEASTLGDKDRKVQLYRWDVGNPSITPLKLDGLKTMEVFVGIPEFLMTMYCTPTGDVLVRTPALKGTTEKSARADWWVVRPDRPPQNISAWMKASPPSLFSIKGSDGAVAIDDGRLWQFRLAGVPEEIKTGFEGRIGSVLWPTSNNQAATTSVAITVRSSVNQGLPNYYWFDLASGQSSSIPGPVVASSIRVNARFFQPNGTAVFSRTDRNGWSIWVSRPGGREARLIAEQKTEREEFVEGELRKIEYRSLDGKDLKGWLILPIGYQEGRRYPLVTWVYAGTVFGDRPPFDASINNNPSGDDTLAKQLLAAHGYAVLLPSMPLPPFGATNDDLLALTSGVLPAVDKVIELGIADPNKLGVIGHSYGGFSTYGLITQTNRFRAAVAMAGPADWISGYGQFDARFRYDDDPENFLQGMRNAETGQAKLGGPPWQDPERYLRNSPLFYADRVNTPLLIIQGDLDYVPIEQGEEFFSALYRQGKRARFVRYWGEWHNIGKSPANVRDMWRQIYAWFDEFLMKPEMAESSKQ